MIRVVVADDPSTAYPALWPAKLYRLDDPGAGGWEKVADCYATPLPDAPALAAGDAGVGCVAGQRTDGCSYSRSAAAVRPCRTGWSSPPRTPRRTTRWRTAPCSARPPEPRYP